MPITLPSPEQLIDSLAEQIAPHIRPDCALVGIHTGGVWMMDALAERLKLDIPRAVLDIAFYRDDFSRIGLHPETKPSHIPFEVEDRRVLLLDDVLFTGRTIRAVINELYDFGRPASVQLAVLVDRGGRQLPVQADFAAARVALPETQSLALARDEAGRFSFEVENKA